MPVLPTIRLLFVIMDKCAVFVAYYRGLDRYSNFIFVGRKISREEYFAGGKFREIPFAVDIIFAGGKFRAKSKFANISSTRKIGVIQYTARQEFQGSTLISDGQTSCVMSDRVIGLTSLLSTLISFIKERRVSYLYFKQYIMC